jgi:2-amino-4-hydroxy-6-hydroxymethyldihydropteridine diphosphokinase
MMQKTDIVIALGSNLGDRESYLRAAVDCLCEEFLENPRPSSVYESEPWGETDQPKFLNMVVRGLSEWKPPAILNFLKNTERELGRTKNRRNGPREIDLDLIAFGERVWESEGLTVPHPSMLDRSFVLFPLAEVWPEWRHPSNQKTAAELVAEWSKNRPVSSTSLGPLRRDTKTP